LVVDANAMLPFSVALQSFQPVARRNRQIFEAHRGIQELQFVQGLLLDVAGQFPGKPPPPYFFCFTAFKTCNQLHYSTLTDISVN